MANRNTQGFGLIPAGRLGGGPSIQGQGKYKIDAGHSTTIYNGECVKISSGYVVGGNGSAADIIGVLNGIFFNAATTLKRRSRTSTKQLSHQLTVKTLQPL